MKYTNLVFAGLLFLQCSSLSANDQLIGEWRFADIRAAESPIDAMTPPFLDVIEFKKDGTVRLHRSLMNREFLGSYTVTETKIVWVFKPEDAPRSVEHGMHFSFTDDNSLVLRGAQATDSSEAKVEWVYLRPNAFLPNDKIAGEWQMVNEAGQVEATRTLLPSGQLESDDDTFWGEYRMWNSPSGPIITTILWVQGSGASAMFEKVEFTGECIVLDGREPPGFTSNPLQTWCPASEVLPNPAVEVTDRVKEFFQAQLENNAEANTTLCAERVLFMMAGLIRSVSREELVDLSRTSPAKWTAVEIVHGPVVTLDKNNLIAYVEVVVHNKAEFRPQNGTATEYESTDAHIQVWSKHGDQWLLTASAMQKSTDPRF